MEKKIAQIKYEKFDKVKYFRGTDLRIYQKFDTLGIFFVFGKVSSFRVRW